MKTLTLKACLTTAVISAMSLFAAASDTGMPDVEPSMLYAPLVYDNYTPAATGHNARASRLYNLNAGDEWLQDAISEADRTRQWPVC